MDNLNFLCHVKKMIALPTTFEKCFSQQSPVPKNSRGRIELLVKIT